MDRDLGSQLHMNRYCFSHPKYTKPRSLAHLGHIEVVCPPDADPHEYMQMETEYFKRKLNANMWTADPLVSETNYWYVDYWYDSGLK